MKKDCLIAFTDTSRGVTKHATGVRNKPHQVEAVEAEEAAPPPGPK